MATRAAAEGADYIARACMPRPNVNAAVAIDYKANGKPRVYVRRYFVLAAYCLCYFGWSVSSVRVTPMISEYALYFNTTNEFSSFSELGIDFIAIFSGSTLLLFYPIAGQIVDSYGLGVMSPGSIGMAVAAWWWFLSYDNFISVLMAIVLNRFSGAVVASCLLRVSHNWFPESQRAMAVAMGAFSSIIGAGGVLLLGPLFHTGDKILNFDLKSCKDEFIASFNQTGEDVECFEDALQSFCCAAPTDVDGFNFFIALFMTAIAIFTVIVTKDGPPSPPSRAGMARKAPKVKEALGRMFANRNYMQICLADFLCSGPPLLIFSTIDRIFPPRVDEFSTYAVAGGFVILIPVAVFFSIHLGRSRKYYEFTAAGYVSGCCCFIIATIFFMIDTEITDYLILFVGVAAFIGFMVWSIAVYELKMEYVFSADFAIQGYVVAVDRFILSLSTIVFLAAIPPERFDGKFVNGRQFTFLVGCSSFIIGTILAVTLPHKRRYRRQEYETLADVSVDGLEDEDVDYPVDHKNKNDELKEEKQIAATTPVEELL